MGIVKESIFLYWFVISCVVAIQNQCASTSQEMIQTDQTQIAITIEGILTINVKYYYKLPMQSCKIV
jgi:hypothetical protein